MSDSAIHAFGTLVKLGNSATALGATYATIPECKNAPIPGTDHPRIDVSTHDNTGFTREYVANLGDYAPVSLGDVNWLPNDTVHAQMQALNASGAIRLFKTYLNSGVSPAVVITFLAYVATWLPNAPVDNVYTVACTLQPTSAPTYGSS